MRRESILALVIFFHVLFISQPVLASTQQVVHDFVEHVIKNDQITAESFLISEMIKIPEIKKRTQIDKFVVLPTPQYEDTKIVVTYFKGEVGGELIAFIWELVVKNGKISRIKVIHDGTNPLLEEAKIIKEYQMKFQKNVFVPSKIPFEVTGFDGFIDNDRLTLYYRSEAINGFLKIYVSPIKRNLEQYKEVNDEMDTLKDGTKILFKTNSPIAYGMMFQKDGLQYYVGIGNRKFLKKSFTKEELIQLIESMDGK
ncbi:hypothetical protein [Brevibacillus sp. 179-C 1.1 NHS]|uniref:hypothetical protein n=1 Tax=Brevibacillus sp. 179-C 1.1 NHS TaxID=3235177 RepID=UPI0039A16D5C